MTSWPVGWLRRIYGLVVAAGLLVACGAPGLDVAALSREPILTAPVEAVELGRSSAEGSGLGAGVAAVVEVAFAVQLSPEEAAQKWLEAYGRQYNLADPGSAGKLQVLGSNDDVGVSLAFVSFVVAVQGSPEDYQEPPAGATVVTIVLSGHLEGETDYQ